MSPRRLTFAFSALAMPLASPVVAAPTLNPLFGDHAVLQRDRPIRLWGTAEPRERLTIVVAGVTATAQAGADGRWRAELPAMRAGGPYQIEVTGERGNGAVAHDLLVGDVWLCSGQSNMEFTLSHALNSDSEISSADDDRLRIVTIPKKATPDASDAFAAPFAWSAATPQTVGGFSAACYFMVRALRDSEHVPIGAISASWGGTAIRSWLDDAANRRLSSGDVALLALFRRDPAAANRQFGARWEEWWRSRAAGEPWRDASASGWKPMPKVAYWETWGDPAFAHFDGMVWARKRVTLTAQQAAQPATLSLGIIDEIDETWVNGVPVGNTFGWDLERHYPLPARLLHAGDNEILVNLLDSYGFGGFRGPAEIMQLGFADGTKQPLGEGWSYKVAQSGLGDPPRPPWDVAAGLSLIHNGMIAPLGPLGLKGVAWYQGESDAGAPAGYADKLRALMAGWRSQFGASDLPFLVVSLANYGSPVTAPGASGWAQIREAQREAVAGDGHSAVVLAMDIGERSDIHPANKQEVGRRLARAARALAYAGSLPPSGPQILDARRTAEAVVVRFGGVTGQLHGWSGSRIIGFELCGETQASCRYADAVAAGDTVRLIPDRMPATRVRYAWSDAPVVNLYDEAPLPAGPFEVPIR